MTMEPYKFSVRTYDVDAAIIFSSLKNGTI